MIKGDQPAIFDKSVIAAVSSVPDGNMRFGRGDDARTVKNRLSFLGKVGINPEQTTLVQVTYDNVEAFSRYSIVSDKQKSEGVFEPKSNTLADALITTKPGHALFLPLADCVGVILHDPINKVLMVSHVGRHSAEIDGARLSVEYMIEKTSSRPSDIKVWLSPGVGRKTYPIFAKSNRGLQEIIFEQLLEAGVKQSNIQINPIDTAENKNYFSHSQFLAGNRKEDGRFAIVAMMRD